MGKGLGHIQRLRALAMLAGVSLLAACNMTEPMFEPAIPLTTAAPVPRAPLPKPSTESEDLTRYYARFEQEQLTRGLLRTDGGGVDTPFTARDLAENFERIALYDEYILRAGRFVADQSPSRLRRWDGPIRVEPVFGLSVPQEQRAEDRDILRRYVDRLRRISGADIRMNRAGSANYHVLFLNIDEQRRSEELLRRLVPGIDNSTILDILEMNRFTFCSVYAFSSQLQPDTYVAALAIIRAEHPPLLRQSCIHEELAQGMGLANDSPDARPSIFNDDDEFALLTTHDENLLRILYDSRLEPGLGPAEARPIVQQIANDLIGGES